MSLSKRLLPRPDTPTWVRPALGVLAVAVLVHLAHAALPFGGGSDRLFDDWLYDGVMLGCAAVCLARGLTIATVRAPWLALGASLVCDAVAEVLSSIDESLLPDVQRALYACFYLGAYVAIALLGRRRIRPLRASLWLDGVGGMLAVAALGASALFAPVLAATHGGSVEAAFNLAYPLADVLMIAAVVGFAAAVAWQVDRPFAYIAAGFAATAVADGAYLYEQAYGSYVAGTPQDTLWLLGALILACAAWQPDGEPVVRETRSPAAIVAAPLMAGTTAIGVLVAGNVAGSVGLAAWLAVVALVAVMARLVVTLVENIHLTAANRELAHSDALTGLGNRRALFDDLQTALAHTSGDAPRLLLLFDLNGFKSYNDTFGHPAGDALLRRLAQRLSRRVGHHGRTYRLGGDEFCALFADAHEPQARIASLVDALSESGQHYAVGACCGEALLGLEAPTIEDGLRIADQRLYTQKMLAAGERRPSAREWVGPIRERGSRPQQPVGGTPRQAT